MLQLLFFLLELHNGDVSCVVVVLEFLLVYDSRLLPQLLVLAQQDLSLLFVIVLDGLVGGKRGSQFLKGLVLDSVVLFYELQFLTGVTQDHDRGSDLGPKFV